MIRVVIVEGCPERCEKLRSLMSVTGFMDVSNVPAEAEESMLKSADVVICDLAESGDARFFDQLRRIAKQHIALVLSASSNPIDAAAAVQAGASGYLTWSESAAAIVGPVIGVSAGNGCCDPGGLAELLHQLLRRFHDARRLLSQRELEVLGYIARGFTHQQTARRMGVSKCTVDTYVTRIRSKLRVGNKAELTLVALALAEHG